MRWTCQPAGNLNGTLGGLTTTAATPATLPLFSTAVVTDSGDGIAISRVWEEVPGKYSDGADVQCRDVKASTRPHNRCFAPAPIGRYGARRPNF